MSVELQMLIWVGVLSVLLAFPYTLALIARVGPVAAMSYPQPGDDNLPDWARRAKRAHLNMVENIAPFAIVVIAAALLDKSTEMTALGAQIFFWARVVMVAGHTLAIPFVRTTAWFVSLAGLILILDQLL